MIAMNDTSPAIPRLSRFGNPQLFFVVDPEFAEEVSQTRWSRTRFGYLESICRKTKQRLWLHRFVWQLKHGWFPACLDHINGLRWDCRISNLRPATRSLNSRNRRVRRQVDLPRGVRIAKNRKSRPYEARISLGGKQKHLGYFDCPIEAGNAYRTACEWISGVETLEATMEAIMAHKNTPMPGDAEYLAAVSGLPDQTPSPAMARPEPAVGDFVSGTTAGKRWQGRVEWIEDGRMTIDVGGGWLAVPVADITH